jgi:chemotaxis protein MotB
MSAPVQPIIIVKKKAGHGGHHGGAWKVAYADFVTAMMAFFLVMWLVGQSKSVKEGIGGYFRNPAVFESQGGRGVLPGADTIDEPKAQAPVTDLETERRRLEAAVEHIKERLNELPAFQGLKDQIEFTVTPEGLRIDLLEKDESSFFASGSAVVRPETERILTVIARELGALEDDVVVEGHTDSRPYAATDRYSNWELSADRANAARRVLERSGLRHEQVTAVRGLADRQLRVPSDPYDARNRRVAILVRSPLLSPPAESGKSSVSVQPAPEMNADQAAALASELKSSAGAPAAPAH